MLSTVRSILSKPKMITESDEVGSDASEIFGSIKSYIIFRSRKTSFFTLPWPN